MDGRYNGTEPAPRRAGRKAVLPLLPLALLQGPASASGWTTYVSAQDRFTVELPGKPSVGSMSQSAQGVTAKTRNYMLRSPLTNVVISVVSLSTNDPGVARAVARGVVKGFMGKAGGTAGASHPATYGGLTGTETLFRERTGHSGSIWTVERPGKVYSFTVIGVAGPPTAAARRIFTSFKLR